MTRDVDVAAIGEVLVAHGHDPVLAAQWAKAGRRAGLVELYCRVGVWHPDAAEAAENAGLGVGELAHHQARSWGDTLDQLDQAIAWYDSDEAADGSYDPADLAAAKSCLEAVRERHAGEAAAGAERVPLPWEVEDNRLPRYRQPQVRVAVALIETTEGVLEVWPGVEDHHLYRAEALYDPDEGDGRHRSAPCRLHHGVALDDHDAVSVLEDFLEAHIDTGLGIVHWEPTDIFVPHHEGQVPARIGLVFDLDGGDANWRFTPSLLSNLFGTGP